MTVTDSYPDGLSEAGRTLWTAALALARAASGVSPQGGSPVLPPLLFFTDPERTPRPWVTAAHLPAGAAVVYRHFGGPEAGATARRLRAVTAGRGVRLLIGLDADLADAIDADGVHLPERARMMAPDLRSRRPEWLITAAVHCGPAADAPATPGLDALVLSPAFSTNSPSPRRPAMGPEGLTEAAARAKLPVYALGGIDASNVRQLTATGVCGIAGVEAFSRAFAG